MPEIIISGITVNFPFEPYALQRNYMAKVIECLENEANGVLESPTGTGKTLCLLCAALAWLTIKKTEFKATVNARMDEMTRQNKANNLKIEHEELAEMLMGKKGTGAGWAVPKIIYASRTHSQLSQAMQELKRSGYSHVKAAVIGSRDQLCIHPDVVKETTNANKIHMCKLKVTTRTCSYHQRVESSKEAPHFRNAGVLDIEDLVTAGRKLKCCPYFVSRELIPDADIVFMPYNYLLDPMARKANKVELNNTIVILDEAHNVEKICEESASVQLASSEVAVCIDELTHVLKAMEENRDMGDGAPDFTQEDVALLKEMMLSLEETIDHIDIQDTLGGQTFPGGYIFEFLAKANITDNNFSVVSSLLDNLIQFLTTVAEQNSAFRRGSGLQKVYDLLTIVFSTLSADYKERIAKCYKVHVEIEEQKAKGESSRDGWLQPKAKQMMKKNRAKVISYWCFSPGFGMQQLLGKNTRSVILTSGTLAPLKPLITELAIPIRVQLENPHIVTKAQVCVQVVCQGPDKEPLISNYENRDNPKYLNSLGRTVLSFCPVIPHGLLIFFTSYFMLNKCRDSWQATGIWSQIKRHKPIFIEPSSKDVFVQTMTDYYASIDDPVTKGAIFMAVCRGKVSEGLDFADTYGRAVMITGLPFPPFKDPRIVLKKKYLQENRTRENEMMSGDEWYFLEATRAVNQAIGRVIRHKDDYGAILLCDYRFNQPRQKAQLSSWIQGHLKEAQPTTFGPMIGAVSRFFRNAERTLPQPGLRPLNPAIDCVVPIAPKQEPYFQDSTTGSISYKFGNAKAKTDLSSIQNANEVIADPLDMYRSIKTESSSSSPSGSDFLSRLNGEVKSIDFNNYSPPRSTDHLVNIHKRERTSPYFGGAAAAAALSSGNSLAQDVKKRKLRLVANDPPPPPISQSDRLPISSKSPAIEPASLPDDRRDLLKLLKSSLSPPKYALFIRTLTAYQRDECLDSLVNNFIVIFDQPQFKYLFRGMRRFVKESQKDQFDERVGNLT